MRITIVSRKEAQRNANRGNGCEVTCCICGGVHSMYMQVIGLTGHADNNKARYIGTECATSQEYHDNDGFYVTVGNSERFVPFIQNKSGEDNTTTLRKPHCTVELEIYSKVYGSGGRACKRALGLQGIYVDENGNIQHDSTYCEPDEVYRSVYIRIMMIGYNKCGHGQHISLDCTVTAEGHAWFKSLQGLRKFLDHCTEEELECFRNERCGAHIHASTTRSPEAWMFEKLLNKIEAVGSDKRIELFGSDFRSYATDNIGGHGCTINVYTGYDTCEMRLTRIDNADQFLQICKFWRACVATMNDNFYMRTVNNKIARQFDRLLSGAFRKGE